ncbi:MAG: hypothetical protein SGJ27_10355 [Candidatus Melainabacteria bacterium]|nr:hypothetical protein [Candidatus Melainabacteria bacterium]
MRHDMHAVLKVASSRSKCRVKGLRLRDLDDAPTRQTMRQHTGGKRHNYGRTNPLRGYLAKQVGRLWSEVYSEICAINDLRSHTKYDLREKVGFLVETNVIMVDGMPFDTNGEYGLWHSFWVHPETGMLMQTQERTRRNRYRRWHKDYKQVPINATQKYVEIDGLWYLVNFAPFTRDAYEGIIAQRGAEHDVADPAAVAQRGQGREGRSGVCGRRRQRFPTRR